VEAEKPVFYVLKSEGLKNFVDCIMRLRNGSSDTSVDPPLFWLYSTFKGTVSLDGFALDDMYG
jgi:hypothetical protein